MGIPELEAETKSVNCDWVCGNGCCLGADCK